MTAEPVNILVVDDRAENRTAARAILRGPSYRIVEAASSEEALLRLLEHEFAVLLVDVLMPELNGFELAAAIRERERTAAVPIIFVTGLASDVEQIYKGYRAGAVDYLIKPLVPEIVRAKVAVFAELYRQRKQIEQQAALVLESQRKDSQLELVELQLANERRYHALADAVPHIIWTAGPDGVVDYFNHRWFEYTGITAARARGSWLGALHPDDVEASRDGWERALRTSELYTFEGRLRRARDDAYHWHLCRVVPELGASGQVASWVGTFTDIEHQKRGEAVLAEFKATLDAVLDAVLIFEATEDRLLYVNQGAGAMLGYAPDELLGLAPAALVHEEAADELRERLAQLRAGSATSVTFETTFRRRGARAVPVEVSLQHIAIDGGRIVAIARDVTDRRRAGLERELLYREAIDAIRARDEFLSVASHELRTPLSALQLQLEMLLSPPPSTADAAALDEVIRTQLERAARQTDRLSQLVAELLDVSRLTAGRMELDRETFDLAEVVRDVVERLAGEAARARCPVRVIAPAPVTGSWDRLRLEQVVVNLLGNAFKFGKGKPVELEVSSADGTASLAVRDHGVGIAAEDVERIFHRYEQARTSRRFGGMGLGLYIVRGIVEIHGGTIRVASQPGAGSTFIVELPREPPEAGAHDEPAGDPDQPGA